MLQSAAEQHEDDLISGKEMQQKAQKYVRDYLADKEVGNTIRILPFGLHRGKKITEIETDYLKWLMDQEWFEEKQKDIYNDVKEELEGRE